MVSFRPHKPKFWFESSPAPIYTLTDRNIMAKKKRDYGVYITVENLTKKDANKLYWALLPIIASSPGTIVWEGE